MTRDEILSAGNARLQAVIDRCHGETVEIERQRVAAMSTLPGVSAVFAAYDAAVRQANAARARACAAADASLARATQDAVTQRYAADGKTIGDARAAKTKAERTRDTAEAIAEREYVDALAAADHLAALGERDTARATAQTKRDAAVRSAARDYADAVNVSDRQYVDDLAAAASSEVDFVQSAMQQATAAKAAAQAAYDDAIRAADEGRREQLRTVPTAAAVEQAFEIRRTQAERDSETEKAAILQSMKTELAQLSPLQSHASPWN